MYILQMKADILEVMFDFRVADSTKEVLGVNFAITILPLIIRKGKSMKFDYMLANVTFFRAEFSAYGASETTFIPS